MTKEELLAKLDPELAPLYEAMPEYSLASYEMVCAIRTNADTFFSTGDYDISNRDDIILNTLQIPNGDNSGDLELRTYRPAALTGTLPCILYFHGGGCVLGKAFHDDFACTELALKENCVVVNVDYRCAPDYPAPAGQLDALSAWKWLISDGIAALDIDPESLIIYGGSGGGNITIGLVLRLIDSGLSLPAAAVPLYPMIDDRCCNPSSMMVEDHTIWGYEQNQAAWDYYIHGLQYDGVRIPDGYTAPARRESFQGFPKTFTYVGGMEVFRDENIEMVRKMCRDGVDVEFHLYPGCFHGFDIYAPAASVSQKALKTQHQFIQKIFYPNR